MNPRDVLVSVLNEMRVPVNADALIAALAAKGVQLQAQAAPVTRDAAAGEPKPE